MGTSCVLGRNEGQNWGTRSGLRRRGTTGVETQGLVGASRPTLGSFVLDTGLALPGSTGSGYR